VDGIWQALCQVNFIFMAMNELVKNHTVSIRSRPPGVTQMNGDRMGKYSYPIKPYKVPKIPNCSSFAERKRLSGPSLRRFFKIMKKWRVGPKDVRLLLGGITSQRFKQLSARPERRVLKQDQLL
jgi:hypothetical protein